MTPSTQMVSATDVSDDTIVGSATMIVTGGSGAPGRRGGADRVDAFFAALAAEGSRSEHQNGSLTFWDRWAMAS